MDWLKNNVLAAIMASIAGLGVIGGGYYIVKTTTSAESGGSGITPIPPRFYVQARGPRPSAFYCDLTIDINAMCRSDPDWRTMENHQIVLARHPGDVTRIMVGAFGTWERGLTWQQLSQGVTVGGYTVQGIEGERARQGK